MKRIALLLALALAGCELCDNAPVAAEACCAEGTLAEWGPVGWYCVGPDGNPSDPALE